MIEKNRKTSLWMLLVLVLILGGFLVSDWGGRINSDSRGNVLRINGTKYTNDEFRRLSQESMQLAGQLQLNEIYSLVPISAATSENEMMEGFFINRILLRDAKEKFGVKPGDEEINQYLKGMRAFSPTGTFDQELYNNVVKNYLGRLGLTEGDLRELASDTIAIRKLGEILGGGLGTNRDAIANSLTFDRQQVTVELATIDKAPLLEKTEIKDDELKSYWETLRDSFKTEPRSKFSYFIATPETVAAPAPKEGEDASKQDPAVLEQRKAKDRELAQKMSAFLSELSDKNGEGFEELAKQNGWEIKTTELITAAQAPADFQSKLRSNNRGATLTGLIFSIHPSSDPLSKFSEALPIGDNQWLIARLDGNEPAREKTFDEARDEAREQLRQEKAQEALRKAANEAIAKIKEQLAAGKSFADAAKEAGLTSRPAAAPITANSRKPQADEPANLFENVTATDPGTLAEPIVEPDRAVIVYVAKREVVKQDNSAFVDSQLQLDERRNQYAAFGAWLQQQRSSARIEQLYKKR